MDLTDVNLPLSLFSPQIHSDPEAADIVFTSGEDVYVVGLNFTTKVSFTGPEFRSNYLFRLHFFERVSTSFLDNS
jgi:inosine-uridine nucleoside N-ribohydrolase